MMLRFQEFKLSKEQEREIGLEMLMEKEVKDKEVYSTLVEIAEKEIRDKQKIIADILAKYST